MAMGFPKQSCSIALNRSDQNVDRALDLLLSGEDLNVIAPATQSASVGGGGVVQLEISQYTFSDAGSSACTAIALSAMKSLLTTLDTTNALDITGDTLRISLSEAIFSGVSHFSSTAVARDRHASVDEICVAMLENLNVITDVPAQGMLSDTNAFAVMFETVRQNSKDPTKYIGIVITKPPETVCVVLPPVGHRSTGHQQGTYVFFDSHSRPELGFNGCYLAASLSEEDIIARLNTIFPSFSGFGVGDGTGDGDGGEEHYDLAEVMYNMFEGTGFQMKS